MAPQNLESFPRGSDDDDEDIGYVQVNTWRKTSSQWRRNWDLDGENGAYGTCMCTKHTFNVVSLYAVWRTMTVSCANCFVGS